MKWVKGEDNLEKTKNNVMPQNKTDTKKYILNDSISYKVLNQKKLFYIWRQDSSYLWRGKRS